MRTIVICLLLVVTVVNGGWVPTLMEDFNNQNTLNLNLWTPAYTFSPTVINSEIEFYSPDAFSFTDSTMKILVEKTLPGQTSASGFNYTSGVITSKGKWSQTYGYFEMRARLPYSTGFWPAFWLLPDLPKAPGIWEIDVMEILSEDITLLHTTYHCDYNGTNPLNNNTGPRYPVLADNDFHSFGLQWVPGALHFYFDRKYYWTYSSVCVTNSPAFLLANVAMGGWAKPPTSATVFPNYMEIDFIRAYKYSATAPLSLGGDVGTGKALGAVQISPWNPTGPWTQCLAKIGDSPNVSEVAPGTNLTFNLIITCNVTTDGIVQFGMNTYKLQNSVSVASANVAFKGANTQPQTYPISITVPASAAAGFYTLTLQLTDSKYTPFFWGGVFSMIGVGQGYTIGHKYAPSASVSPSSVPSVSRSPLIQSPSIAVIGNVSIANVSLSASISALPSATVTDVFVTIPVQNNANLVSSADVVYALAQATGVAQSQVTVRSFDAKGSAVVQISGVSSGQMSGVKTVSGWLGMYNAVTGANLQSNQVSIRSLASPASQGSSDFSNGSTGITGAGNKLSNWLF